MSIIPPDPGRTLSQLRSVVSDLKQLAQLKPESPAYAEVLKEIERAVSLLESITPERGK